EALSLWPDLEDSAWQAFHIYSRVAVDTIATDRALLPLWPIQAAAMAAAVRKPNGGEETSARRALTLLASWTQLRRFDEALPRTREVVIDAIRRDRSPGQGGRIQDRRLVQIAARPEAYILAAARPRELQGRSLEE